MVLQYPTTPEALRTSRSPTVPRATPPTVPAHLDDTPQCILDIAAAAAATAYQPNMVPATAPQASLQFLAHSAIPVHAFSISLPFALHVTRTLPTLSALLASVAPNTPAASGTNTSSSAPGAGPVASSSVKPWKYSACLKDFTRSHTVKTHFPTCKAPKGMGIM
ncbi:hypothetical protein LTR60_001495 [Cryomyces antarcticus]|nr:hypothetical protein LTR60_001495 [Cryomyces antarcticus]